MYFLSALLKVKRGEIATMLLMISLGLATLGGIIGTMRSQNANTSNSQAQLSFPEAAGPDKPTPTWWNNKYPGIGQVKINSQTSNIVDVTVTFCPEVITSGSWNAQYWIEGDIVSSRIPFQFNAGYTKCEGQRFVLPVASCVSLNLTAKVYYQRWNTTYSYPFSIPRSSGCNGNVDPTNTPSTTTNPQPTTQIPNPTSTTIPNPTVQPTAAPTGIVLSAVADAYVGSGPNFANSPRGKRGGVWVGFADAQTYDLQKTRTLLRFDVSSLAGKRVTSAKIRLYLLYAKDTQPLTMDIKKINQSWNEDTVIWNAQPTIDGVVQGTAVVNTQVNRWQEWTVSADLINSWIVNSSSNFGVALISPTGEESTSRVRNFTAREYSSQASPQLIVNFEPAATPTLTPTLTPSPTTTPTLTLTPALLATPTSTVAPQPGNTIRAVIRNDTYNSSAKRIGFARYINGQYVSPDLLSPENQTTTEWIQDLPLPDASEILVIQPRMKNAQGQDIPFDRLQVQTCEGGTKQNNGFECAFRGRGNVVFKTTCPDGKKRKEDGRCDEACCSVNSECPSGQACNIGNGVCSQNLSCNAGGADPPDPQPQPSPLPNPPQTFDPEYYFQQYRDNNRGRAQYCYGGYVKASTGGVSTPKWIMQAFGLPDNDYGRKMSVALSQLSMKESAGIPNILNSRCFCNPPTSSRHPIWCPVEKYFGGDYIYSQDFSVGLFQINALGQIPDAFVNIEARPCVVKSGQENRLHEFHNFYSNTDNMVNKVKLMSSNLTRWTAWADKARCNFMYFQ